MLQYRWGQQCGFQFGLQFLAGFSLTISDLFIRTERVAQNRGDLRIPTLANFLSKKCFLKIILIMENFVARDGLCGVHHILPSQEPLLYLRLH